MADSPRDVSIKASYHKYLNLKCLHLNIRSARNKDDDLTLFLNEFTFEFDIIILTETWYDCSSDVYKRDGYQTFYLNRSNRRGGGIAIIVNNKIECDIVQQFSFISSDIECLTLISKSYVLSVIYRPPECIVDNFIDHLEKLLNYVNMNSFKSVLGGDFNIDILRPSPAKTKLLSTIHTAGHDITTKTATRVTAQTETLIDIFVTNITVHSVLSGVISNDLSDHFPIYLLLKSAVPRKADPPSTITIQNITPATLEAFSNSVINTSWDTVFQAKTADAAYEAFISIFKSLYHKHFPEQKF